MATEKSGNCWSCGGKLEDSDYGRQHSCPGCGKDTHVCRNCGFHDRSYNNECRENQADRVVEKERANFCDYFSPVSGAGAGAPSKDDLLSAADALFKKK